MPPGNVYRLSVLAVRTLLSLLMLAIGWPLILLTSGVVQGSDPSPSSPYPTFVQNDTVFEHLALHPDHTVGRVYIGARDHLFQLNRFLQPELQVDTGPVTDSRECLPPVTKSNCPQARTTNNHNKLLLVDPYSMELITCGSVNQGICQKRNLDSVDMVRFSTTRPVDTQYVAANHPNVSTVGVVVRSHPDKQPLLFVGRGYTSSHPPISTRNLAQEPIFSYEETAKLAVAGRLSEYDHNFVASFAHRQHVYFLFHRRDLKSQSREHRTYVSRVCLDDQSYYSYVEIPLICRSRPGKIYNLLQAVQLGLSKDGAASQGSEILLGVFSTILASSNRPSEDSALCLFNLEDVDRRINSTRDLCYTQMGREAGVDAAYIEYEVKSNCANLPENTLDAYPCGSDHTPSPMASRIAVEAETILDSPSARLTAVSVSVRLGHTIAFLGDSKGNLHKVFLGPNGEVEEYSVISIQQNACRCPARLNMIVLTWLQLQKRPVAECQQHPDCHSCLLSHDPYCGWCVLEGRCVLQSQCARWNLPGQWLWSFDMEQQCLTVQDLNPSNISREESRMVSLSVPGLPVLERDESYSCFFQDSHGPATVTKTGVTCQSPNTGRVPTVPPGHDFVRVTLSLRFGDVTVTERDFIFYDCMAVKQLSGSMPCHGCVLSQWGCNWCVHQHLCTHKPTCEQGVIIYNQHGSFVSWGSSACPCVEKVRGSSMLPVRVERKITLQARNLHLYQVPLTHIRYYSICLGMTLYNCSVGRSDCSRCHTADQKYGCVWCGTAQASCLYSDSCSESIQHTCPAPVIHSIEPLSSLLEGGTMVTISGSNLGQKTEDILDSVSVAGVACNVIPNLYEVSSRIVCRTKASGGEKVGHVSVEVSGGEFGQSSQTFKINNSFGGRLIYMSGHNMDVVQEPRMVITVSPYDLLNRITYVKSKLLPLPNVFSAPSMSHQFMERCEVNSSSLILCRSPMVDSSIWGSKVTVEFLLDNLRFDFSSLNPQPFSYEPNPVLRCLNQQEPLKAYRYNPGSFIQLEGENLDLAITKDEVVVLIGEGVCAVKTLTRNHLYCEPPPQQPAPGPNRKKREGSDNLPEFTVQMGNLNFSLGKVLYDNLSLSTFPLEAQIGVGVGASIVALIVLIIVLIYRRKSKQALRDYKKVQIQLENLETSVRDRCKKEFTDLMTEMMDMSSDLVGSGIPFLDYRMYAERIFFPGHRESPLRRDLDVQECRRQTVEHGLVQLSNLLNSKLFLTKFIYTLESQRTFSPRDRAYVASLLTVALHGKLEYFTDILKTLLNDLVEQYVAKNPKLMLRRTETVVEKLLTNWMSICLYAFLRDSAGESLYMLFRAIKHQVDKGPVDAVTGKAKYTLNDNRLLREDVEYKTLTVNVLVQGGGVNETQPLPSKVLDCDTITQVKEKLLDQVFKGTSFSHRPHADSLDLEWRSGVAGHLILSDEDLTSVVQGNWKRLNTLQHYKVPDGATVALVPRHNKHIHHDNHDYIAGEKTPMLEDADEGGVRLWHLVKASEEPELPKHRRGSLRERERAKAIPEIYLTRLLSMKGTLQKFVDDLFTVILSTSRPVPLAVKYFFDLLDDQAGQHGISDPETIHIWKTNSLPLRFWINVVKNPQFIFDVQASDHVDAVLSVISQTFMDSCTIAEHKLGRDSPINKLLYARDIPRYKQMVERYYADIRQTISASDQEMNSALAELSRVRANYSGELNYLVALHELYKYINKYYDQIITALEEDTTAQKMQLGYRLQQIAAAVENKVTDL
uniref:Plexin-B1 n=1 Tax=Scophthalmus maximus TaxID=52904 RepID=A0A8D3EDG4_SCOMX